MIYGRTGNRVTIQRLAKIEDVKALDKRKPNEVDREAIAGDSYVVTSDEHGTLRLYHLAFLRADGGGVEISAVVAACKANDGVAP